MSTIFFLGLHEFGLILGYLSPADRTTFFFTMYDTNKIQHIVLKSNKIDAFWNVWNYHLRYLQRISRKVSSPPRRRTYKPPKKEEIEFVEVSPQAFESSLRQYEIKLYEFN